MGRLLRSVPGELGFEWSFGLQFKTLRNLKDWLKVRTEVVDLGACWLTAGEVAPLGPVMICEASTATTAEFAPAPTY